MYKMQSSTVLLVPNQQASHTHQAKLKPFYTVFRGSDDALLTSATVFLRLQVSGQLCMLSR